MEAHGAKVGEGLLVRSPAGLVVDPGSLDLVELVDGLRVGEQLDLLADGDGTRAVVLRTAPGTWHLERRRPADHHWAVSQTGSRAAVRAWLLDAAGRGPTAAPLPAHPSVATGTSVAPASAGARHLVAVPGIDRPRPADGCAVEEDATAPGVLAEVVPLHAGGPEAYAPDGLAQELRSSLLLLLAVVVPIVGVAACYG